MNELHFFSVDMKYISKLHSVDENVMSVSPQIGKEMRPFVGVIVLLNGKNYCIPLTSPKDKFDKKSNIDFIKILDVRQKDKNGAPKIIGVLNINNMIPIHREVITKIDLSFSQKDRIHDRKRKNLMQDQLKWCRDNAEMIIRRANKVHDMIVLTPEKNKNLTRRCCDFKKLEAVLDKMMKRQKTAEYIKQNPDKIAELLKESDQIINSNPSLKKLYEAAEAEYFKNTGLTSTNPTSSMGDRYYERNAVISSNAKLKEEYVAVKNKIRDQSLADSLPTASKPKKH